MGFYVALVACTGGRASALHVVFICVAAMGSILRGAAQHDRFGQAQLVCMAGHVRSESLPLLRV